MSHISNYDTKTIHDKIQFPPLFLHRKSGGMPHEISDLPRSGPWASMV